ncbi:MAG: hypothetical protein J7578_05305, partial [Chitinophagaceae bacterium]|nr:hypothetical protein [Chitinophagaceae bacterium]
PWQISSLLLYRKTFGKLLSIYELQAIPGWDEATIIKLLPYISISSTEATDKKFFQRFKGGEENLLMRSGKWLSKEGPAAFIRYRYKMEKQLQWGFTMEKDAGEGFFRGAQKNGFDFYSAHLFARRTGPLQVLALGDFLVNMGQGLIQWQGMSYAYGAVLSLKKQSEVLQPYSSAGEFNFHRGIGISTGSGPVQATAFVSYRKLSAHLKEDSAGRWFNNFVTSGYHRTASEQEAKGTVNVFTTGTSLRMKRRSWQIGVNAVQYHLSVPLRRPDPPYKLFAIEGDKWSNASFDYGITIRNWHVSGELAIDQHLALAFTGAVMGSLNSGLQLGIQYRNFSKQYQSLFSSAVSQGAAPSNEEGIGIRIEWQPQRKWRMQASADIFRFPWLRYRIDAPANGYEHLITVIHQVSKKIGLQFRYQLSSKPVNQSDTVALKFPAWQQRKQWRLQWSWEMNEKWKVTQRTDYLVAGAKGILQETGISCWLDATYKPDRQWMLSGRLHFYETGGYQSRIYSYERDLLYSYSMPAFAGNAIRVYTLVRYRFMYAKARDRKR